jgi:hypothetical protein
MKKFPACYSATTTADVRALDQRYGARSTLNSPSTSVGDYQTNDLDRSATSLNGLAAWSCKPSLHEACDHVAIEPMRERKLVLRHAVQNAVEQAPVHRVAPC